MNSKKRSVTYSYSDQANLKKFKKTNEELFMRFKK